MEKFVLPEIEILEVEENDILTSSVEVETLKLNKWEVEEDRF